MVSVSLQKTSQCPEHMETQRKINLQAEPNLTSLSTAKYWEEKEEATLIIYVTPTKQHTKGNIMFDTYV